MPIVLTRKNLIKKSSSVNVLDLIIKICLYLIVFLVPLFFLPISSDPIELNKVFIFSILVLVAVICWLIKFLLKKEQDVWPSPLALFISILFVILLISTIFSTDFYTSLVGMPTYYSGSLVVILFFILFYFLFINNQKETKDIVNLLTVFLVSSFLIVVFNILQLFKIHILPWDFAKLDVFNLISNSVSILSVYSVVLLIIILGFLNFVKKNWAKIALAIFGLADLFLLFILDKNVGWYSLIFGLLIFLIFLTSRSKELRIKWTLIPTIILVFAVVMIFVPSAKVTKLEIPDDVLLNNNTSAQIVKSTLVKKPIFGSGPETFYDDFTKFRPVSFNNSSLYGFKFIKSTNEWWQLLSTTGIFGVLAVLAIYILYLWRMISCFLKTKSINTDWYLKIIILSSFLVLFFSSLLYPLNFVMSLVFWLFLALGMGLMRFSQDEKVGFLKTKRMSYGATSITFALLCILVVIFMFFGIKIWLADYYYNKANLAVNKTEDIQKVENYFKKSVDLYPVNSTYYFALAQNYIVRLQIEAQKQSPDLNLIKDLVQNSINYAKRGQELNKNQSDSYQSLAAIYQSAQPYSQDDLTAQIVDAYNKTIEKDPNNPATYLNFGKFYLGLAVNIKSLLSSATDDAQKTEINQQVTDNLDKAKIQLDKATQLKENFVEAEFYLAAIFEVRGEMDKATEALVALVKKYPNNYDIWYELASVYYSEDKLDQAQVAYSRVTSLYPDHANAHYQLSAIYEKQGKKDLAISEMETVLKLNPDNAQVKAKLDELKK